jgi:hypothetical protein
MEFFLEGVATIADEAVIAAREAFALISEECQASARAEPVNDLIFCASAGVAGL